MTGDSMNPTKNTITVLLVEDHQIVRQGLRSLLNTAPGFRLVGDTGDGLTALQMIEQRRPDVLVLDLMLPGLNGLEVARQSRKNWPQTRIVVLSMHANEAYVAEAFRVGVAAYVLKSASSTELVSAIRAALDGRRYLSPPLSERSLAAYEAKLKTDELNSSRMLTTREREVLQLVAEGHTSAEIANRLAISPRTVEMHRHNLMEKLGLYSQAEVIRYAIQNGIISVE